MRTIPIAPANVEPDLLGRDVGYRDVNCIDMKGDAIEERIQRLVAEHDDPLHREIGCVQLQDVAFTDDVFVFLLEFIRDTHDVLGIVPVCRVVGREQHRG